MKIKIVLNNCIDCQLDAQIIDVSNVDDLTDDFIQAIRSWTLSVGDTIKIEEIN